MNRMLILSNKMSLKRCINKPMRFINILYKPVYLNTRVSGGVILRKFSENICECNKKSNDNKESDKQNERFVCNLGIAENLYKLVYISLINRVK